MYGIIAFFRRHYFTVLFAALEFLCLFFVFRDNYYHQAGFFNSANSVAGSFYKTYSGVTSYFHLKGVNEELAEENAQLHNHLAMLTDTSGHKKTTLENPYGQQYTYITAKVVDNSTNMLNNYLTLDAGRQQGVHEGMGVLSPSGIAGIVVSVSDHYSVVMSMLHKSFQLSAVLKQGGAFGTVSWKGGDYRYASLSQIPMSEKVKRGDTVVTSGFSTIFPKEIMVGIVDSVRPIPTQYFYAIQVRVSTNFKKLRFVYIVNDLMRKEKTQLEDSTYKAYREGK